MIQQKTLKNEIENYENINIYFRLYRIKKYIYNIINIHHIDYI